MLGVSSSNIFIPFLISKHCSMFCAVIRMKRAAVFAFYYLESALMHQPIASVY